MQTGLIGLDLGTTTIKAVLMDESGTVWATAAREYVLETSGDRCEIEPDLYWTTCLTVIAQLLHEAPDHARSIRAISFSSQGETVICLDEHGRPLRKAIVWLDNRSTAEAEEIWKFFGKEKINRATGQVAILPFWTANRILWIRKHEPAVFRKIHKILLVEDYIIYRFTGRYATDQSLNSSTLYYNIFKKEWWAGMLSFLQITEQQLPEVFPSGTLIGSITASAATESGLPESLQVVAGTFDHVAGAIGAGNIEAGIISETTGASMAMVVTLDKAIDNIPIHLPMQCHALEGKYLLLPYAQTAGMMFRWFRDTFCQVEMADAARVHGDAYDLLTEMAAQVIPGSEGLLVLPHLMGSGSPEFNVKTKAVFAGMTLGMNKAHFSRAIMESIAYMIKRNLQTLSDNGLHVKEIRALGGGSKSGLWNQIKSDILDVPIYTLQAQETAAVGAAILAGVGCGVFENIRQGCIKAVHLKKRFLPAAENHAMYEKQYQQYLALSDSLDNFW